MAVGSDPGFPPKLGSFRQFALAPRAAEIGFVSSICSCASCSRNWLLFENSDLALQNQQLTMREEVWGGRPRPRRTPGPANFGGHGRRGRWPRSRGTALQGKLASSENTNVALQNEWTIAGGRDPGFTRKLGSFRQIALAPRAAGNWLLSGKPRTPGRAKGANICYSLTTRRTCG